MLNVKCVEKRNPVTFKNQSYDPSTFAVIDIVTGRTLKVFQGFENAMSFVSRNQKPVDRNMVKTILKERGIPFSAKDNTSRLVKKLMSN